MKKIAILLIIITILTGCGNIDDNTHELNVYKTKEVCKLNISQEVDGELLESESRVYLDYDGNLMVNYAIYQSIIDTDAANSYTYSTYDYIKSLYSDIKGINVDYYNTKDSLVLEVRYDYSDIDLGSFRSYLGDLIDKDSLLGKVKELPVKLEDFKNIELKDYECEVK